MTACRLRLFPVCFFPYPLTRTIVAAAMTAAVPRWEVGYGGSTSAISAQGRSAPLGREAPPTYRSVTPATPRPALSPARALYTRSTHTASTLAPPHHAAVCACRARTTPARARSRPFALPGARRCKTAGRRRRRAGGAVAAEVHISSRI